MNNIPALGQFGLVSGVPAAVELAHVTVGPATTNDVVVGDTNTYTLFQVDEPIAVLHMWTQVETAFTASVTVDIGDSGSLSRFSSDTTIAPASTGAVLVADTGIGTVPYVYAAAQNITVDINGATVAAGLLHVYMQYAILRD